MIFWDREENISTRWLETANQCAWKRITASKRSSIFSSLLITLMSALSTYRTSREQQSSKTALLSQRNELTGWPKKKPFAK